MIDTLRIDPLSETRSITIINQGDCEFSGSALGNHPHSHPYEICFVIDGSGKHVHDGDSLQVSQNDLFLAEPGIIHEVSAFDSGYLRVFYAVFDLAPTSAVDQGIVSRFLRGHTLLAKNQESLRPLIEQILVFEDLGPTHQAWVESAARLFLLAALQSLTSASDQSTAGMPSALKKALAFIRSHASERPTLSAIAHAAGTSPRNLQLLFKQHMGRTVIETVNEERCKLASQYLDMGFRCAEVGTVIGIDEPCQFSRFFKRYMGMSPSDYRNRQGA